MADEKYVDGDDVKFDIGDLTTFLDPARAPKHEYLGLNPAWHPISAGDRLLPAENDTVNWFNRPQHEPVVEDTGPNLAEPTSEENFQEQYHRIFKEHDPPGIFIPMRFRLPDLPLKLPVQRQLELDEGLSLYLPKTLIDKEFKTELEEEIVRLIPSYADFERYFDIPGDQSKPKSAPAMDEMETWIVRKRHSKLCIEYKHQQQRLRQYLHKKWLTSVPDVKNKLTNTMFELSTFRRSRPDWRSYVTFVRVFAHRYDFLPNLLQAPLRYPPSFPPASKLMAFANELNLAKNDPTKCLREFARPLLNQYKTLRMTQRIAKRKAELALELEEERAAAAAERAKNGSKNPPRLPKVAVETPPVIPSGPKTFRQRIREGRRILEQQDKARARAKQSKPKHQRGKARIPVPIVCSTSHEDRRLLREARRKARRRECRTPRNPFRVKLQDLERLYLGGADSIYSLDDSDEIRRRRGIEDALVLEEKESVEEVAEVMVKPVSARKTLAERTKNMVFSPKSPKSRVKQEALWRKRERTKETENFSKILKKIGGDATSRALHREGMVIHHQNRRAGKRKDTMSERETSLRSAPQDETEQFPTPPWNAAASQSQALKTVFSKIEQATVHPNELSEGDHIKLWKSATHEMAKEKIGSTEIDVSPEIPGSLSQHVEENSDEYYRQLPQLFTDPAPRKRPSPPLWRHKDDPTYRTQYARKVSNKVRRPDEEKDGTNNMTESEVEMAECAVILEEARVRKQEKMNRKLSKQAKQRDADAGLSGVTTGAVTERKQTASGNAMRDRHSQRGGSQIPTAVLQQVENTQTEANSQQTGQHVFDFKDFSVDKNETERFSANKSTGQSQTAFTDAQSGNTRSVTFPSIPEVLARSENQDTSASVKLPDESPKTPGRLSQQSGSDLTERKDAPKGTGTVETGLSGKPVKNLVNNDQADLAKPAAITPKATGGSRPVIDNLSLDPSTQRDGKKSVSDSVSKNNPLSSRFLTDRSQSKSSIDLSVTDQWNIAFDEDPDDVSCLAYQPSKDPGPIRPSWRSLRRHQKIACAKSSHPDKSLFTYTAHHRPPVLVSPSTAALMGQEKVRTDRAHSVITMLKRFDRVLQNEGPKDHHIKYTRDGEFVCAPLGKRDPDKRLEEQERALHITHVHPRYYTPDGYSGVVQETAPVGTVGKTHFPPRLLPVWRNVTDLDGKGLEGSSESSLELPAGVQAVAGVRRRKKKSAKLPKFMRKWKRVLPCPAEE